MLLDQLGVVGLKSVLASPAPHDEPHLCSSRLAAGQQGHEPLSPAQEPFPTASAMSSHRIRYSATAAPNREPAFRQICPHCQRRCSEYGEPTDPKINICARRLSSPHKQLVEQNAVGNGGFSIRFRRRGLPHSGSSCCHLAEPDRKDNCGDRTSSDREPTIRRSSSRSRAGRKGIPPLERRTAPLPAVTIRPIPIVAFACVPREQGR